MSQQILSAAICMVACIQNFKLSNVNVCYLRIEILKFVDNLTASVHWGPIAQLLINSSLNLIKSPQSIVDYDYHF